MKVSHCKVLVFFRQRVFAGKHQEPRRHVMRTDNIKFRDNLNLPVGPLAPLQVPPTPNLRADISTNPQILAKGRNLREPELEFW